MLAKLTDFPEAELWAQKATALDAKRAEARMWLAQKLRGRGGHHKASRYLREAEVPEHKLFTELLAYDPRKLAYERSLCHWYIFPDREAGMRLCLEAQDNCVRTASYILYNGSWTWPQGFAGTV